MITGHAYRRRATLEVTGETLTWRAQRGQLSTLPENVVTTIHDVRDVRWIVQRWSISGLALIVLGLVWVLSSEVLGAAIALAAGAALLVWRFTHPRQYLVLVLSDRQLVMKVALPSGAAARALVAQIDRVLASGELPASPPALP